jgi:tRNA G18 (ribose-2'-O)-methylase SpoU
MSPRQLGMTEVKRLNRDWRRRSSARLGLLLDGVGQPFNVGSIIRSAAVIPPSPVIRPRARPRSAPTGC